MPSPDGLEDWTRRRFWKKTMNNEMRLSHPIYTLLPSEIEGLDSLTELALDMRWSWNHATDRVWRAIDPEMWELTQNPWVVLQTVSPDHLAGVLAEPGFRKTVDDLLVAKRRAAEVPGWFQQKGLQSQLNCVAYFSMEFMLSEALPIYSGGLGNVAGDQLKAASDLGVPVIGVGLLFQQGYFRQMIDKDGCQEALYPYNDPGQLPITPLRYRNGEWLRLEVSLPGYSVWLRAWQVQAGRVRLYLLDSNDPANVPERRPITSELYGGGPELRLEQELVLGIGGWQLLRTLGIRPEVCHLNEGHAAFAALERARDFMEESGQPFEVALATTRAGNVFTTHTAVSAGFDHFEPRLIEQYLKGYAEKRLHITLREFLALGRQDSDDPSEGFNMAYLAIRGSGSVNAVSNLHGKVSRQLFAPLFSRWPEDDVPIGHVTNGVHMSTWDSAAADDLWTEACGKNRWFGTSEDLEKGIRHLPDSRLWECRTAARRSLIEYARERLFRQLAAAGEPPEMLELVKHLFDPNALTIGFARRFATYKRPNLLLQDPERLLRLLASPEHPVQLIIAGKAHPADEEAQGLIKEWVNFIRRPEVRLHAIFLSDYDMHLSEALVQGVDLWINTPRRPWEACGTSGMKVLVNGGINLSELDGWWAEAYSPEVGWALGDGQEHANDRFWDATEAAALYECLERQVIPEFYTRNKDGIPTDWVARMRESMAHLTPRYSAHRAVREYTEKHYLPAAMNYRQRSIDGGAGGRAVVDWLHYMEQKWPTLSFGQVRCQTLDGKHMFEVEVNLKDVDPSMVRVELYAEAVSGYPIGLQEMNRFQLDGEPGTYLYSASVQASRPASDYTARLRPYREGVSVPLETNLVLWQR
jgi:starch phosphorylase